MRDLRGEVQAREIMGDEAYFGTASLISKIITYEQAMDEISNRKMIEGTRDMRVTWAEFRGNSRSGKTSSCIWFHSCISGKN